MTFITYITTVLMSLSPSYGDVESWEARNERMTIIAKAIDDASSRATCSDAYATPDCQRTWPKDKKSLAILLVTKGFWESHFSKNVHEGKCRIYECDAYKTAGRVYHRAKSPWQIQKTGLVTSDEYSKMAESSLESTTISANVATRYLTNGYGMCKTIQGAMASYAGAGCSWKGTKDRFSFYERLYSKTNEQLQKEMDTQRNQLEARLSRKKK